MTNFRERLNRVQARIHAAAERAGRDPAAVQLLAVSKTRPAADIREAFACGQRRFGENYLQEALDKQQQLQDLTIEWHFIGPLQSNKTRAIAENFDWVHSVDRLKVARRLSEQRPAGRPPLNICVQVNLDREASKSGVLPEALDSLLESLQPLPHIQVRGLMAIPAVRSDPQQQRQALQPLADALARLQPRYPQLDTLSMGMSGDLEAAIAAGATLVRIGTDLFGPRIYQEN